MIVFQIQIIHFISICLLILYKTHALHNLFLFQLNDILLGHKQIYII
jgi:hypothetical protein